VLYRLSRQTLKLVKKIAWWVEFLVYLAISTMFVMGGVGIWNVMMAAVSSRTREIGLKKAKGARIKSSPPENLFVTGMSLGVVFAVVLGVEAGFYPSIRATRIKVVTAIHYE
jgi:putative ABC transport system permease protein